MSASPLLQYDLASTKTRTLIGLLFAYEAYIAALDGEPEIRMHPTPAWADWLRDIYFPARAAWGQAITDFENVFRLDVAELLAEIREIRAHRRFQIDQAAERGESA